MGVASRFSSSTRRQFSPEERDDYRAWRMPLVQKRLRVGYWIGVAANLAFIPLDYLFYPASGSYFLLLRMCMEISLVTGLFLTHARPSHSRQTFLFLLYVWSACFAVALMTTEVGGFRSTYYAGLTLVIFGWAVLVPFRWRLHVIAQLGVLFAYYALNLISTPTLNEFRFSLEPSYFLILTCLVSTASVVLYERVLREEFYSRRQLEQFNNQLLELDRMKTQFFANISHELRTPLTLIIGAFRRIIDTKSEPHRSETARTGLRNAVGLLYLINELLDLSRFEGGRMQLDRIPLDLSELVRKVSSNFENSVRQRIHLRGTNEAHVVNGEPKLLQKMIYNLLSNAVKFSDDENGEIWIRIRETDKDVILDVEDNGIGIADDNIGKIFDRFTQVEGSATRRFEGTGIGLALVKEIVSSHEGTIDVESRLGEGSTFIVALPRSALPAAHIPDDTENFFPASEPVATAESTVTGSRDARDLVLVADDNRDMREYLRDVLEPHFRVQLARDGAEALGLAKSDPPALVLTDIMMPNVSGHDLLANLRSDERLRDTPVVFVSALSASESRLTALRAGVDDIVTKPFNEDELIARLRNAIEARHQQRETAQAQVERLRRFLPDPVAKILIEQGSETTLESHRAEITTVFFDLRGFTSFAEQAAPEELIAMLGDYQTQLGELIDTHGGTLERFSGDAIMVFFNDPIPAPDHTLQGLRLAFSVRAGLPKFEQQWKDRGFTLGVGIGVATGYATIGMIGYEKRRDYAALGSSTNLAARLCSRAESGQILVPEKVVNLASHVATFEPVGQLRLHGIRTPVDAFNLIDMRTSL